MKISLLALSVLAFGLPAQANPQTCLERQLADESMAPFNFNEAQQVATVNHAGKTYDWILLSSPRFRKVPSVIVTDSNNSCEMPVFDPGGNLTSEREYQELLGAEVYAKFQKAFQGNQ